MSEDRIRIELTDGVAFISPTAMAQDPWWEERWRQFLAARAAAMYGKRKAQSSQHAETAA